MAIPNPWYTRNNPSESYQVPRQNLLQNLQSELNPSQTNQGPEGNYLKNLLMELKLSQQIFGILIKQNEKRSDCKSETTPTFRRIQDILH